MPSHHTTEGFRNPDGRGRHEDISFLTMLGFYGRRVRTSLLADGDGAPESVRPDREILAAYGAGSPPSVTWLGHSTVLVQLAGLTFLTDPTWSDTASPAPVGPRRYVDPPLPMDALPPIDFVLVSHNHYDHLDLGTLKRLAKGGARIFLPLANAHILERAGIEGVRELDWWQTESIGGATITCVPAQHWSQRGLFDRNRSLWSGWVVEGESKRFYFAGDTAMFDGFQQIRERIGPPDLAALPIGAYLPEIIMSRSHLNPEEAVRAAELSGAKRTLAVHYGTFDLSDEPIDEPPRRFAAASAAAGRGPEVDWLFRVGESRAW